MLDRIGKVINEIVDEVIFIKTDEQVLLACDVNNTTGRYQ